MEERKKASLRPSDARPAKTGFVVTPRGRESEDFPYQGPPSRGDLAKEGKALLDGPPRGPVPDALILTDEPELPVGQSREPLPATRAELKRERQKEKLRAKLKALEGEGLEDKRAARQAKFAKSEAGKRFKRWNENRQSDQAARDQAFALSYTGQVERAKLAVCLDRLAAEDLARRPLADDDPAVLTALNKIEGQESRL